VISLVPTIGADHNKLVTTALVELTLREDLKEIDHAQNRHITNGRKQGRLACVVDEIQSILRGQKVGFHEEVLWQTLKRVLRNSV
jgi:hypothetical protein